METENKLTSPEEIMPSKSASASLALPGPIELFRRSFTIYREKFWTLIALVFTPALFNALLSAISIPVDSGAVLNLIFSALKFLLSGAIGLWSAIALILAIGLKTNVVDSYRQSLVKILPYFWVYILSALAIFGGLILLIVPGIVFAVWFYAALFIVIFEKEGGLSALLKSRAYIIGQELKVLWRIIVLALFYLLILLIVGLIILPLGESWNWLVQLLLLFVTPLVVIYPFLIYRSLRELKSEVINQKIIVSKWPWIAVMILGVIGTISVLIAAGWFVMKSPDFYNQIDYNQPTENIEFEFLKPADLNLVD